MFVALADNQRPFGDGPVVQLPGDLILQNAALLFDHQNLRQAFGELMRGDRLQGPTHADFINADADGGGGGDVET